MKKLKRFLIICLFSFIFLISNVKAQSGLISSYSSQVKYTDEFVDIINSNSTRLDSLHTYLSNIRYFDYSYIHVDLQQEKYILRIDNINTNTWRVGIIYFDSYNLQNYFRNNSGDLRIQYRNVTLDVTFNNDVASSHTVYSYGGDGKYYSYSSTLNPNNSDVIFEENSTYFDTYYMSDSVSVLFQEDTSSGYYNVPIYTDTNDTTYYPNDNVNMKSFFDSFNLSSEPTYTINQQIQENGSVKLTFNFTNYNTNNGYGFTITNKVSGEEYGITNPFTSIYPNIIPFGNSYEITIDYDTVITVSLSKYTLIEGTELYDREPLYVDSYDINNVVFENLQEPSFSIIFQSKNNLIGKFNNINNGYTCYYKYSNTNVENLVDCASTLDIDYNNNGYVEIIIKKNNNVLYNRKINIQGGLETQPYIVYNIEKQDFYSKINWYVENFNNQLYYRYSLDNGANFTNWENLTTNQQFLNIYQNSTIIIEISNNTQETIYDSKAINVIVSIENLKNFNNTTNNLIDKFDNLFNINGNILSNVNSYWQVLKNTKIYLIIFIPFITSIICAIIYLIRRK